ncbi:ferredoxin [Streptomyces sp. NPDC059788]|uniref:ferredoxin n=1 Tax=Streptomyces sp. NPDC059788 TaxID=3346948 RepID=UPI00364DA203
MADHRWEVEIDRGVCIASGMCVGMAPGHFRLHGGRSQAVHEGAVAPDDALVDAAESCPAVAITVRHATTGELVAPEEA